MVFQMKHQTELLSLFDLSFYVGRKTVTPSLPWCNAVYHLTWIVCYDLRCHINTIIQSKFDNSKRKGPQEIFRMSESSNFRESSKTRICSVIFIQTMVWPDLAASIRHFGAYIEICAHGMEKMCL